MIKVPITVKRVRAGRMLFDTLYRMEMYVPDDPMGRARLVVNPSEAFDRESFRSRKMNGATLILACPAGFWQPRTQRCGLTQVIQAVHYAAGQRNRVVKEFCSGRLQARHTRDQDALRIAREILRRAV